MNLNNSRACCDFPFRLPAWWAGLGLAWGLLLCHQALAAPVNADSAAAAAKGWLRLDHQPLGQHLSAKVGHTETVQDGAGAALFHVVHLDPAGYVIVSADDTEEPFIAFSAGGRFDSQSGDPMAMLVKRDLRGRMARLHAGGQEARHLEAHRKWKGLLAASPNPPPDSGTNNTIVLVSQVWVAPLVQTLWSQDLDISGGYACYNYFTPDNYPCGCVATCMAQLMYYYQYPAAGVGTKSFPITVNGQKGTGLLMGGDSWGGPYLWTNMPLAPNNPTAPQAQAVGELCFDAGAAINMDYESGGSSAFTYKAPQALTSTFGYSNVGMTKRPAAASAGQS